MVAALGDDFHLQIRKGAAHVLHNPIAAEAIRYVILNFASHDTIRATDAALGVDDHGVTGHVCLHESVISKQ
jgi:hypothetical protein